MTTVSATSSVCSRPRNAPCARWIGLVTSLSAREPSLLRTGGRPVMSHKGPSFRRAPQTGTQAARMRKVVRKMRDERRGQDGNLIPVNPGSMACIALQCLPRGPLLDSTVASYLIRGGMLFDRARWAAGKLIVKCWYRDLLLWRTSDELHKPTRLDQGPLTAYACPYDAGFCGCPGIVPTQVLCLDGLTYHRLDVLLAWETQEPA